MSDVRRQKPKINPSGSRTELSKFSPKYFWKQLATWFKRGWWQKAICAICALVLLFVGVSYGLAEWYIWSERNKTPVIGATFISDYATYLGVEPHETLHAMIHDLGIQKLRLVSYWDNIEKTPGTYDFSGLDWQFKMAEDAHVPVSLAIGLRQPRWPECHMPDWAMDEPKDLWYPQLKAFMSATIAHYKTSPVLDSYQLENEFFLTVFGECKDFDRNRLVEEAAMVKLLDPDHTLIISRSNNGVGWPVGAPVPDEYGVSVYKRVWDKTLTKRYFEYPFPAWFYGSLAGISKLTQGKDMVIHELQTEAWLPDGYDIKDAPVSELYKSMSPERLDDRINYGLGSGMKEVYLWGVEWWYQMKVNRNEPGLWDTAKQKIQDVKNTQD